MMVRCKRCDCPAAAVAAVDFLPLQLTAPTQMGRRSDMDPNGHVNNVAYLAWAMEVVPEQVFQDYQLCEVS
jgi:fatty acyl-ACP thioesterase A